MGGIPFGTIVPADREPVAYPQLCFRLSSLPNAAKGLEQEGKDFLVQGKMVNIFLSAML